MNYSDKLLQKLEEELKEFKSYIKEQGVDFAIDKAYELTVKQEIIDVLIYDSDLILFPRILYNSLNLI